MATQQIQVRTKKIEMNSSGEFVLVVEIRSSAGSDLHMVDAYGDHRFYKRGEKGTVRMTEPEVRETYSRIALAQVRLDERLYHEINGALKAHRRQQNVVVVPCFPRHNLLNPRVLGKDLALELRSAELCPGYPMANLRVGAIGLRDQTDLADLVVRRDGLVLIGLDLPRFTESVPASPGTIPWKAGEDNGGVRPDG